MPPRIAALGALALLSASSHAGGFSCSGAPKATQTSCQAIVTQYTDYLQKAQAAQTALTSDPTGQSYDTRAAVAALNSFADNGSLGTVIENFKKDLIDSGLGPMEQSDWLKKADDYNNSVTLAASPAVELVIKGGPELAGLRLDNLGPRPDSPGTTAAEGGRDLKNGPPVDPTVRDAARQIESNPGAALKSLDRSIAQNPTPQAYELRAQAKAALGDRAGALADARQALKLNPEDKAAQALVSQLEGLEQAKARVDGTKLDFGDQRAPQSGVGAGAPPVAMKGGYLVPGADVRVPAPGVVPPTVAGLFQTARDKLAAGDDDGALLALHEAVDLDPTRPDAWETISEVMNKEGDFTGAIAAADKALAIDPKDARALRAKAYAEFNLGQYQQAFADANRAVSLDPGNGLGYLYRAMAEEKLGMKDEAVKDYRLAEKYDPALMPAAEEGLRRLLGGSAPDAGSGFPSALARRVGVVGGSGLLILLGLLGTASGRRVVQEYTRRLKTVIAPPGEPRAPVAIPEAATVALGAVIGGHYRVTGELGRGGMGAVYKAHDEKLQRPVAVKQLLRDARDPETMDRLLKEARLVAKLQHPHIAEIYSVITDRDPMLVFEFVDGESLDKTLHRAMKLPPERARKIVAEVCSALEYAHGCGIIHRDLKPANVMIAESGSAKVMDFGIAHQSTGGATQTKTATAAGTPPYMAPEQNFGSVSRASDLYALGAMAYELLTGFRPFDGPDYLEPKLRGEFEPVTRRDPALPAALDKFFAKALNPDPTKRYLAARDFSKAFAAALEGVTSPG